MAGKASAFPAQELFAAYPALRAAIDALCERPPWRITGVSALLVDAADTYWELAKPKHWRARPDGITEVGLGAIGGSIESGESALGCLQREAQEEIGVGLEILPAAMTHLVYEQRLAASLPATSDDYPAPALFTISQNLHRQADLGAWPTLAIVTFWARPLVPPRLGDLYGLLSAPRAALAGLLTSGERPAEDWLATPGVRAVTQEPLPERTVLVPTWTGRSFQRVVQAGLWKG